MVTHRLINPFMHAKQFEKDITFLSVVLIIFKWYEWTVTFGYQVISLSKVINMVNQQQTESHHDIRFQTESEPGIVNG